MESRVTIFFIIAVVVGVTKSATVKAANQTEKKVTSLGPIFVNRKDFYIDVVTTADWFEAIKYCEGNGHQLAIINDSQENDALFKALNNTAFRHQDYWTSANDLLYTNEYSWDSNGQIVTYTNFREGEPNHLVIHGEKEHCIKGRWIEKKGFLWDDVLCSTKNYIICEKYVGPYG